MLHMMTVEELDRKATAASSASTRLLGSISRFVASKRQVDALIADVEPFLSTHRAIVSMMDAHTLGHFDSSELQHLAQGFAGVRDEIVKLSNSLRRIQSRPSMPALLARQLDPYVREASRLAEQTTWAVSQCTAGRIPILLSREAEKRLEALLSE